MNQQPPDSPLFVAVDNYLINLTKALIEQKERFQESITADLDYESIIKQANQKTTQRIDAAIQDIEQLRKKLKKVAISKEGKPLKPPSWW